MALSETTHSIHSLFFRFGRKKAVFFGLTVFVVCSIVTTFSVNVYMYTAIRFFAGFGNRSIYIPLFVLGKGVV